MLIQIIRFQLVLPLHLTWQTSLKIWFIKYFSSEFQCCKMVDYQRTVRLLRQPWTAFFSVDFQTFEPVLDHPPPPSWPSLLPPHHVLLLHEDKRGGWRQHGLLYKTIRRERDRNNFIPPWKSIVDDSFIARRSFIFEYLFFCHNWSVRGVRCHSFWQEEKIRKRKMLNEKRR